MDHPVDQPALVALVDAEPAVGPVEGPEQRSSKAEVRPAGPLRSARILGSRPRGVGVRIVPGSSGVHAGQPLLRLLPGVVQRVRRLGRLP